MDREPSDRYDERIAPRQTRAEAPDAVELRVVAEAIAARFPQVSAVFLFGSLARGDWRPSSDVDLAILTEPPVEMLDRIPLAADISDFAAERLGVSCDVLVLHADLRPRLLFSIFQVETPLFARDPERAHRYACWARAEYRDLLPRLERADRRAMERLKEYARAYRT
jgi:predicted nucleotidyltransferase